MAAFLVTSLLSTTTKAELRWERTELEISPSLSEAVVPAEFRFTNTGPDAVRIVSVRPDCGCVVSNEDAHLYAPGESGNISVVFKQEGHVARRDVPIDVVASGNGKTSRAVLVLHVRVHDPVQFSEKFIYWRANQPLEARTVSITLSKEDGLSIANVSCDSPAFRVALSKTPAPEKYSLTITPPAEHGRALANIIVTTTSAKNPQPLAHHLIARVW